MKFKYTNNLSTNLYETISNRDEVIKVQKLPSGITWPTIENSNEVIPLTMVDLQTRVWEIVYVHQVTLGDLYDTLVITRSHEGTGAASFAKGAVVENRITAAFLNNVDSIPLATTSGAGIVKVGSGLSIADDGTLSANIPDIDVASHDTAGIVKIGDSLDVDIDGTINFNKIATKTSLGLVKVGNGLILASDGTLSTDEGDLPISPLTYYEVTLEAEQDLIAPYTLELPDNITYTVGTNTLELSVEGTQWYRGKQFLEIGATDSTSNQISILGNITSGNQINIRVPDNNAIKGKSGDNGVTFIPSVSSDGIISWTNDGGLDNPAPVNIKGPAGDDADTSNCVLLTGNQTVGGIKTFSSNSSILKSSPIFSLKNLAVIKGTTPETIQSASLVFTDSLGANLSRLISSYDSNGAINTTIYAHNPSGEGNVQIKLSYPASGSPSVALNYAPAADDNSLNIPTTSWVNNKLSAFSAIPSGLISMWSGSASTIPTGWLLCDGTNGTPDLRDRFILGAGSTYNVGDTGGSTDVTVSGTVGATTLSTNQMPSHTHGASLGGLYISSDESPSSASIAGAGSNRSIPADPTVYSVGGSSSHTHTASLSGTGSNMPPYYALCFIMKS